MFLNFSKKDWAGKNYRFRNLKQYKGCYLYAASYLYEIGEEKAYDDYAILLTSTMDKKLDKQP